MNLTPMSTGQVEPGDGYHALTMFTAEGVPFLRTPESAFGALLDFPWPAEHIAFEGLRLSYVDAGPRDGPVALLMHGMPTWSYLNRGLIARLTAAGYRCIAADHIGFGRSDKVVADAWYSIERHARAHAALIEALDLKAITLFCQDWGGPIGLAQVATHPERFARLVIMNTWLHHAAFDYTPATRQWQAHWRTEGLFAVNVPYRLSLGWLMLLGTQRITREQFFGIIANQATPEVSPEDEAVRRAYDAPFALLGAPGHAGPRRFPLSIPIDDLEGPAAKIQAGWHESLLGWTGPVNFIWGGADEVFPEAWGRAWAARYPQATFDLLPEAGHFLQDTHSGEIGDIFLARVAG